MPLKALKDYDRNPRRINKDQFDNLVKSIKEDGYHQRLVVNTDGTIIGGHQRKKALIAAGVNAGSKVKVLLPDRLLHENEFKRINIRDNAPYGEFDMDILASDFDIEELLEWGLPEEMFPSFAESSEKDEKPIADENKHKCPECGFEF